MEKAATPKGFAQAAANETEPSPGDVTELLEALRRDAGDLGRLLRRVRDFAEVRANGRADHAAVDGALRLEGVDERGLDELDRKYMRAIASIYAGGPVGLEAVAATLGEDAETLEDLVEPFLLQIGFLARTRQGRRLTRQGADAIGFELPQPGQLFEA